MIDWIGTPWWSVFCAISFLVVFVGRLYILYIYFKALFCISLLIQLFLLIQKSIKRFLALKISLSLINTPWQVELEILLIEYVFNEAIYKLEVRGQREILELLWRDGFGARTRKQPWKRWDIFKGATCFAIGEIWKEDEWNLRKIQSATSPPSIPFSVHTIALSKSSYRHLGTNRWKWHWSRAFLDIYHNQSWSGLRHFFCWKLKK